MKLNACMGELESGIVLNVQAFLFTRWWNCSYSLVGSVTNTNIEEIFGIVGPSPAYISSSECPTCSCTGRLSCAPWYRFHGC